MRARKLPLSSHDQLPLSISCELASPYCEIGTAPTFPNLSLRQIPPLAHVSVIFFEAIITIF